MTVLDTHALVFAALDPARLGTRARAAIDRGAAVGQLAVADVTLWEIAMLAAKGRLVLPVRVEAFLADALERWQVRVVPISPAIAGTAAQLPLHGDPADRLIVATALTMGAELVTVDALISASGLVAVVW